MQAPRVIFIHCSKTGGTTLRDVLKRQYGPHRVRDVDGYRLEAEADQLGRLPDASLAEIHAFCGHMPVGLGERLACPSTYITLLRDPVERIVSHYHWVLRTPSARLHGEVVSRRMSVRSYVEESSGARFFNNGQTRLLGAPSMVAEAPATEATLNKAKRNLERFAVAGLAERFEESLLLMRRELGWRWPVYRPLNVGPRRPDALDLSDEEREAIVERNLLDVELHDHVCRCLEERVERLRPELDRDLIVLRALNRAQATGAVKQELPGRAA
jgi:hypothetical protein